MSLIKQDQFRPIHLNYRQISKTSENFWDSDEKEPKQPKDLKTEGPKQELPLD